jgi:hypothetical protein
MPASPSTPAWMHWQLSPSCFAAFAVSNPWKGMQKLLVGSTKADI